MFRFLFRFTGLVLITLSFLFVVYDGTKSIADQTIYISRVGPTWVNRGGPGCLNIISGVDKWSLCRG